MNRILLLSALLFCAFSQVFSQDADSDFRICDGLPGSQKAFFMALGSGELRDVAIKSLAGRPGDITVIIQKLFHPAPTSLLQLNGRVDDLVGDPQLANSLEMALNAKVASKLQAATSDNIVCSMSLLSYREASDVFGKRIANQYGVVQVTMRNTDGNHEFLLHQVDFWFGDTLQYYATRDRKIARGVAEKGQVVDMRNATVRVLEGIGAVAGPATNVFSNDAQLASSIFNSSFIPAVKSVFPDLTVQQVAKLDDMGFSAGASTMVIPKSGAISFVAFIPADSFLIPKLAQYEDEINNGGAREKQLENCSKLEDKARVHALTASDAKNTEQNKLSPDELKQLGTCDEMLAPGGSTATGALNSQSVRSAKGKSTNVGPSSILTLGLHTRRKNIGSFDAVTVLLLQKDLQIMVSGSHIQALTTQLTVTSVNCTMPDPLVKDSTVTCDLTGNSLTGLTQGRLINQTDSTISVPSSGLKTDKSDPSHAQLSFPGCSFASKPAAKYVLEISGTGGNTQVNSPQSFTPHAFTCTRGAAVTCQIPTGTTLSDAALTGTDGVVHAGTLTANTASFGALPSGNYSMSATIAGKTTQFCSVSF